MIPRAAPAPLDEGQRRRHKWRNRLYSVLLIGGMVGLLALCAWIVFGAETIIWVLLGGGLGLIFGPRASPRWALSLYRAQRVPPNVLPELHQILAELARRAGLPRPPELYYVPSRMLNAFAVGDPHDSAIAMTDGMLRRLDLRELAGVMAHEISHIRNNDLWVIALADTVSRLTSVLAFAGTLLLFLSIPMLVAVEGGGVRWLLAGAILTAAPTVGALLQLALSRAREYDADLDAAGLTGDPRGLASALVKLERYQGPFWEMFMPGRRVPVPSLLRTHPTTEERVRRLLALYRPSASPAFRPNREFVLPTEFMPAIGTPRWRRAWPWW